MNRVLHRKGLLAIALLVAGPATTTAAPQVEALEVEVLGRPARFEVAGLAPAEAAAALRHALAAAEEVARLADPDGEAEGGLGRLNAQAGEGARPLDGRLASSLARALDFCRWSDGAHGPLGGRLNLLWGVRRPVAARPGPSQLASATASAACSSLQVDSAAGRARLAAGSRLDLWGFAAGWAVDAALAALEDLGASNARVAIAGAQRAAGPGPEGRGWRVTLPIFPGFTQPLDELWLRDQSLAVCQHQDRALRIAGDVYSPYVDQRRGRPAVGVVAVIAVTDTALDADALATALFVLGSRSGEMRLGVLRPPPSVTWVLGTGAGAPLITQYRWSVLKAR